MKKEIVMFGGGPSNLIAADILSNIFNVTIYEKEKNIGQKLLVAGKGGFNLTNKATGSLLKSKYTPHSFLDNALSSFDSIALREWLNKLGIPTFVGSSGKVFPKKNIKPIFVLDAIRKRLLSQNVSIRTEHKFVAFDKENKPIIEYKNKLKSVNAEYYFFGLGGASWSITGSNGKWMDAFNNIGIKTIPFQSSNCGISISWSEHIKTYHIGKPLKNISISIAGKTFIGESVITAYGLEGNVIYQIIPIIRKKLNNGEIVNINIDFKPFNTKPQLLKKILPKEYTSKDYAKLFNINKLELSLIKHYTAKTDYLDKKLFVNSIKSLSIPVNSLRPIEEAISTIGGIDINELNDNFSLKKYPNIFTIGEMVDWDAPTGGFLLQGCFTMGYYSAMSILKSKM